MSGADGVDGLTNGSGGVNGHHNGPSEYSIPHETAKILREGILENPLNERVLPRDAKKHADLITYEGSDLPTLPINWRFAESVSALKGLEAAVVNVLLERKYNVPAAKVTINTDHAQLFVMSALLWQLDVEGKQSLSASSFSSAEGRKQLEQYFPDADLHGANSSTYVGAATSIYKTKDDRYFHLHGSMDARPTLRSVGLPEQNTQVDYDEAVKIIGDAVNQYTAEEIQDIATNQYKQAGTIAYSTEEYKASEHGKDNEHIGLFEIRHQTYPAQKPSWWPDSPLTSAKRPLAGLKVVELTRVIAGPAVGRGLAELGASVMRITSKTVTDMSILHIDLNHGKWNADLNLREEADREKLRELVRDADVFLQGYRPHVLDKYGFGEEGVLDLVKDRERGIIYARENCYGWLGPWVERTGWQQISDANVGVSLEFGRAMGNDEAVTPVLPNSDYCTGIAGVAAIISALIQRAEKGGSYSVDIALNYYSRWLVDNVGTYPESVWQDVWARNGKQVFRHYHNMSYMLPRLLGSVMKEDKGKALFSPKNFTQYEIKHLPGVKVKYPAPVLQYPHGEVEPGFQVSTRANGVDQPRWPKDLSVDVVT